jgi:C-terminal processing protease CtpA/Prc
MLPLCTRSGCIQPGDRIITVNGTSCERLSGAQAARLVEGAPALTLLTQFDVAEAVVPASGVFTVNIAVRGSEADIGLTLDGEHYLAMY